MEFRFLVLHPNKINRILLTRYREKDAIKEAQALFPNTSVARDFDTFQIKREE